MLVGLHKPYLIFITILEVVLAGGFIFSAMITSGKLMVEFAVLFIILPVSLYLITNFRIKKEYDTNKIIQTAVTTFRYDEDKFDKLLENQQIIKTPVVRNGKQATLGYQPDVLKKWE